MLACLDRVWEKRGVKVKGRDYYDLLWYMQKQIVPNSDRLAKSMHACTIGEAFGKIRQKVKAIKPRDLLTDLRPLFENGDFAQKWVKTFREQFEHLYGSYVAELRIDHCAD